MRFLLLVPVLFALAEPPRTTPDRILANENRVPAGTLHNGTLRIALDAREGIWHPDAESAAGLKSYAFGEVGKAASIPGPLIRVPSGTRVEVSVTNGIAGRTLKVHGLFARTSSAVENRTSLDIPAGQVRSVTFTLDAPGTYFYYGATTDSALNRRVGEDSQLSGAIVVDAPGATIHDRIFVITQYADSLGEVGAVIPGTLSVSAINGKSWPYTERFTFARGDTVRWRWISTSNAFHPMHLHGFYYRIDARGDLWTNTFYSADSAPYAVTERIGVGQSMMMTWIPERAGNWLFHCHLPDHVAPHLPLDHSPPPVKVSGHMNHAMEGMGGLVLGIHVTGPMNPQVPEAAYKRKLRMVAEVDSGSTSGSPAFKFVLDRPNAREQSGIGLMLNPVLLLHRDEPTAITVVNTLTNAATVVHWHGMELESYFDGVAGFGGDPGRISPAIEPGDSFVARMTPPRAGTFIYHTHIDEPSQEPAGLSGVLIVLEPQEEFDAQHDHPILLTTARTHTRNEWLVNGVVQPAAFNWQAGVHHRLRFVDMMAASPVGAAVSLLHDTSAVQWRPIAKDGRALPPNVTKPGRASARVTIGETADFDVVIDEPGDYSINILVGAAARGIPRSIPVHVR